VHVPFCRELCLYCGCNVVIAQSAGAADPYLEDLAREMDLAAARLGRRRGVRRLHLGGGTPTFLEKRQLARLWCTVADRFALLPGAELAIEIDPVVTRHEQLALLRTLGFNRLSMGVQDFDPAVQAAVNRRQGMEPTRDLLGQARALGFASVNFDLIYGLPHQSEASWQRTLDLVVEMRPDRIAAFSYAHVPEARPHQRKIPAEALPRGAAKLALFRLAHSSFVAAGYRPIGMDHFALPGDDLAQAAARGELARDFQGYTTRAASGMGTVAFGLSAIGDIAGVYAQSYRSLMRYRQRLAQGRLPVERGIRLTPDDRRRRAVITELMCNFRVDLGPDGRRDFGRELEGLRPLEREGIVEVAGSEVAVTPLGRLFVRNVAMVFDARLRAREETPVFSRTV
jgi:oxygen-independent coproporphyrinogen-3 oxidase